MAALKKTTKPTKKKPVAKRKPAMKTARRTTARGR